MIRYSNRTGFRFSSRNVAYKIYHQPCMHQQHSPSKVHFINVKSSFSLAASTMATPTVSRSWFDSHAKCRQPSPEEMNENALLKSRSVNVKCVSWYVVVHACKTSSVHQ